MFTSSSPVSFAKCLPYAHGFGVELAGHHAEQLIELLIHLGHLLHQRHQIGVRTAGLAALLALGITVGPELGILPLEEATSASISTANCTAPELLSFSFALLLHRSLYSLHGSGTSAHGRLLGRGSLHVLLLRRVLLLLLVLWRRRLRVRWLLVGRRSGTGRGSRLVLKGRRIWVGVSGKGVLILILVRIVRSIVCHPGSSTLWFGLKLADEKAKALSLARQRNVIFYFHPPGGAGSAGLSIGFDPQIPFILSKVIVADFEYLVGAPNLKLLFNKLAAFSKLIPKPAA